jgi:hypothetical protein
MPTVIFTDDGSEVGNLSAWDFSTGSPTSSTTQAQAGSRSIALGNGDQVAKFATMADVGRRIRFWVYFDGTHNSDTFCSVWTSGFGTKLFQLQTNGSGVIQLANGSSTQIGSNGSTLPTSTWTRVVLAYTMSGSTITAKVYVGAPGVAADISTSGTVSGTGAERFVFRGITVGPQYHDTILVDDGTDLADPDVSAGAVIPIFMAQYRQRVA